LSNVWEVEVAGEPRAAEAAKEADNLDTIRSVVADAGGIGAGLWITYLSLFFYLAIAAAAVTHRDLLLENPVKLPFLNVDLPLVAFFALAPPLFVVVHLYMLLNFNLIAAKIQRFEEVIASQTGDAVVQDRLRELLPNNILIQYLARPPKVEKLLPLLWLIVGLTLVAAPILLLAFLEVQFLPYHHHAVLLAQRAALVADVLLLWWLWPVNCSWPAAPRTLGAAVWGKADWKIGVAAVAGATLFQLVVASLPDEPYVFLHDELFSGAVDMVRGKPVGWFSNFLVLPDFVAIDRSKPGQPIVSEEGVSISLRGRDLDGAIFIRSDLRSADFTGASLKNARFENAILTRARFGCADDTKYSCTTLEGASFRAAHAERATFERANLRGAKFDYASLQGSSFYGADMRGSHADGAKLQGAKLLLADLRAGWLSHSSLEGATLGAARLEMVPAFDARLQAASFEAAKLQGATLTGSDTRAASFPLASVWRAEIDVPPADAAVWTDSIEIDKPELCPEPKCPDDPNALNAQLAALDKELPKGLVKTMVLAWMSQLHPEISVASDAKKADAWRAIVARHLSYTDYERALAAELRRIGCDSPNPPYVVEGLIDNGRIADTGPEAASLAEAFADEVKCPGARGLSAGKKDQLRAIVEKSKEPVKNDGI
jgi:uncharacterized protein YjbI with pentapeptide repeats